MEDTVKEWERIIRDVERNLRRSGGVKVETPLGEMRVRNTGTRCCAWINSRGMAFGASPRAAVARLVMKIRNAATMIYL
jgi:hypothetical protein